MIRAVLVDDEPPARVRMRQLLAEAGGVMVVGEAGNAVEARQVISETQPDLLFLDVEMPEVRGTALAASLPEPRPYIVFATAYENFALEAIQLEATDYLLKPVSRSRLTATLDRVRSRLSKQSDLERDVAAASAVQAHMWPGALPALAGFESAARSLAARGVGGDFYNMFSMGPTSWALLLGDASGKGVAAGLVGSAVQARVHTAARLAGLDPASLMAAVDRDVYATTDGARYATAIYAVFDADTKQLRLVNAGHPPLLVLEPDGRTFLRMDATGPALGLITAGIFNSSAVNLQAGSLLVAYTDGVTEARDGRDEEFGESRLMDLIIEHRSSSAAALCATVLDRVREHRGTRQDQDDVTVLVTKAS